MDKICDMRTTITEVKSVTNIRASYYKWYQKLFAKLFNVKLDDWLYHEAVINTNAVGLIQIGDLVLPSGSSMFVVLDIKGGDIRMKSTKPHLYEITESHIRGNQLLVIGSTFKEGSSK
jgi:hypothetical protein